MRRKCTDRGTAVAPDRGEQRPLGSDRSTRRGIIEQRSQQVLGVQVVNPALTCQCSLPRRGQHLQRVE